MSVYFIGAGGHAKTLYDALLARGVKISGYVDPIAQPWIDAPQLEKIPHVQGASLVIGFVGLTPEALRKRLVAFEEYKKQGAAFPPVIHPSAIVSPMAAIGEGAQIGAGAIINAYARIGMGAVINTGAVIEHDASVGPCAHVAPRAAVLGGAHIGECAFVGSQAVVIQGKTVPPEQFVKALSVYPPKG